MADSVLDCSLDSDSEFCGGGGGGVAERTGVEVTDLNNILDEIEFDRFELSINRDTAADDDFSSDIIIGQRVD